MKRFASRVRRSASPEPPSDGASKWRERALEAESALRQARAAEAEEEPQGTVKYADRKRVFDAWLEAFGKKRGVFRAGDKRDRAVKARLRAWSVEELCKCVRGFGKDPWRHVQFSRHELATLLRNDGQVEQGLEMFNDGGASARAARNAQGSGRDANKTIDYSEADRAGPRGVSGFR